MTETVAAQPLNTAINEYLEWATIHTFKPGSGTPRTYRIKLDMYARHFGPDTPVHRISGKDWMKTCGMYWASASAETYNSGRRAALSFLRYCRDSEPPLTLAQPPKLWKARRVPNARDRSLPQATVVSLFDPERYPLRERTLWSLLYDSSERMSAVLGLDIPNVDLANCIGKVRVKGGDTRYIAWTPYTSELLRLYIGTRDWGPVFLGEAPPWNWRKRDDADKGPSATHPRPEDPGYGHLYRLTAHRARVIYTELTGLTKPHRVRHSRLQHLGAQHGTSSPMLKAISGHETDRMLARYSQPSPEQVAAFMAHVGHLMDG